MDKDAFWEQDFDGEDEELREYYEKQAKTPYQDEATGNLVLQVMSESPLCDEGYFYRNLDLGRARPIHVKKTDDELRKERETDETAERTLEEMAQEFTPKNHSAYSEEYFQKIHDDEERRKAYQSIVISSHIPEGEEKDILQNPFKFLGVESNSDFATVRAAWINLAKKWHPDKVNVFRSNLVEQYFGAQPDFLRDGETIDSWSKRISMQAPDVKSESEISAMSTEDREHYVRRHQLFEAVEQERTAIKSRMGAISHDKMRVLNLAYKVAQDYFSGDDLRSLAGFKWEDYTLRVDLGESLHFFRYKHLSLEGDGLLSKEIGPHAVWPEPILLFDYGTTQMARDDYRQQVSLRAFFAWADLKQGNEFSSLLLKDIVDHCELNDDQTEQLRLMLINRESVNFMLETLGLEGHKSFGLIHPANTIMYGPKFTQTVGWDSDEFYSLGVEFREDGGMTLRYLTQDNPMFCWGGYEDQANFTSADVKMMRAIAYGPLLLEMGKD